MRPGAARKSIEERRAWVAPACAAAPPLSERGKVGGKARGDAYRALPATEQMRILVKLAIGRERWKARRDGLPPPVIMLGEAEPDAEGGYRLRAGSARVLTDAEVEDFTR
jgi:hypothetical protein